MQAWFPTGELVCGRESCVPDLAPHWPFQVGSGLHFPCHNGTVPYTVSFLLLSLHLTLTALTPTPTSYIQTSLPSLHCILIVLHDGGRWVNICWLNEKYSRRWKSKSKQEQGHQRPSSPTPFFNFWETEAQGSAATCPKSHSKSGKELSILIPGPGSLSTFLVWCSWPCPSACLSKSESSFKIQLIPEHL